ncbi:MAG: pyruvate, phosphate dikinase [Acidobacteriota bacterium]
MTTEAIPGERKYVYAFGDGAAEGSGEQKELLGGKGAGLAEMSLLGIPVPPGFTLTTDVCRAYGNTGGQYPDGLGDQIAEHLSRVETALGSGFGSAERPLLFSVRSGAAISMPGMMDTILNLGLNDEIVAAASDEESGRFLRDCYRRLLTMYGDVVLGVPYEDFYAAVQEAVASAGCDSDQELSIEALDGLIARMKEILAEHGQEFPQDPQEQLWGAIGAVFESWDNPRARQYRRIQDIPEDLGTGVTVQAMVFGNRGEDCATGVAFTRNPSTGELELYGEYLLNAQGEDVVAGTHTPRSIAPTEGEAGLAARFPQAYETLEEVCGILERHFRNMQDLEFTIQHGKLFMLQTRAGKRSGPAAVKIAVDMVRERLIDRREAVRRVEPQHLVQMMAPVFELAERQRAVDEGRLLAQGLAAGPGAASGRIAFTAERAAEMAQEGSVILVRNETSPEDIVGMHASSGILTTRGGMTSHAAVVARGLGKPCIVGADDLVVDDMAQELRVGERAYGEGEFLSIDGSRGEVLSGLLRAHPSEVTTALLGDGSQPRSEAVEAFVLLCGWADRERRLGVRANADTPEDAQVARTLGAQGIGLCRTEHMFFHEERIAWVRQMILARDEERRAAALEKLLPMQQEDFEGIFRALAGLPVTIRLLDPPLHEFLPHGEKALARLAEQMDESIEAVRDVAAGLEETNPMLGHRGCRLGLTHPAVYEMQVEAIVRAALAVAREGLSVRPEIMIPLTGVEEEIVRLRQLVVDRVESLLEAAGSSLEILVGTMIEVPRAALMANRIALHSDFFSFGTNDLTQMTYGYSRDDVGRFLPSYIEEGVVPYDPFERLDVDGVGQLVEIASRRGRMARPDLKLGVCGEHGGEPHSIEFFERCGLDYVSCSPYRVPVARLAAARARLAFGAGGFAEGLDGPVVA